jgi:hypothetical protein
MADETILKGWELFMLIMMIVGCSMVVGAGC